MVLNPIPDRVVETLTDPNQVAVHHLLARCVAKARTITELAKQIDVDPSAIHNWFNGTASPRRSSLCRLISFLNAPSSNGRREENKND